MSRLLYSVQVQEAMAGQLKCVEGPDVAREP